MPSRMEYLSTLCYLERKGEYLMLHRTVKKNDVNKDKWIGVGGHFEEGESPEECVLREVKEETGYTLTSFRYRGLITFLSGNGVTEYISLFTADGFTGEPGVCDEGQLEWVPIEKVWELNIWEGDKIFFRLLDERAPFFSLKLAYDGHDRLVSASLNGRKLELFVILDKNGAPTGVVKERGVAHLEGSLHPTVHIWIIRRRTDGDFEVLLQKRSADKDAYPGCYDSSAAGHVPAGEDYLSSAIRELEEELGLKADPADLHLIGTRHCQVEEVFYGRPFRDNEYSKIYVYDAPVVLEKLRLQESEVEEVCWMELRECERLVRENAMPHCIWQEELVMLRGYLERS